MKTRWTSWANPTPVMSLPLWGNVIWSNLMGLGWG